MEITRVSQDRRSSIGCIVMLVELVVELQCGGEYESEIHYLSTILKVKEESDLFIWIANLGKNQIVQSVSSTLVLYEKEEVVEKSLIREIKPSVCRIVATNEIQCKEPRKDD
ncbi:hypothetical protein KIN20_034874 [Parelaphostrongylus tenuis]|uniref:Uncharacterized protein n=1 Tax=Parelaphostrongylus tenuis TaxID=148309 RepID=A0AAD5WJJ1_PARTN|nr:hypothetical protein KIN20_034874 [Parelaphostrongylus tenuis]